jgi:hypothetical protein
MQSSSPYDPTPFLIALTDQYYDVPSVAPMRYGLLFLLLVYSEVYRTDF